MHAGHVVESAPAISSLLGAPPYTAKLIAATPKPGTQLAELASIPGNLPDVRRADLPACRYSARCERRADGCAAPLPLVAVGQSHLVACWQPLWTESILKVEGLAKRFPVKRARTLPWRRPPQSWLLRWTASIRDRTGRDGRAGRRVGLRQVDIVRLRHAAHRRECREDRLCRRGDRGDPGAAFLPEDPNGPASDGFSRRGREPEPTLHRVPGNRRPVAPAHPAAGRSTGARVHQVAGWRGSR